LIIREDINTGNKICMLSVMKLFMEHSYLAEEIKGIVPPDIKKHIDHLKSLSPIPCLKSRRDGENTHTMGNLACKQAKTNLAKPITA